MFRKLSLVLLMFVIVIMLASCSQDNTAADDLADTAADDPADTAADDPADTAADVLEEYFDAIISKDDVRAVNLSCAAWEEGALIDSASFEGVEAKLEDVSCKVVEEDGESASVSCTGNIVFAYAGAEDQKRPLDGRVYHVVFEDGEWRMCGFK